jgi:hypothetical protein
MSMKAYLFLFLLGLLGTAQAVIYNIEYQITTLQLGSSNGSTNTSNISMGYDFPVLIVNGSTATYSFVGVVLIGGYYAPNETVSVSPTPENHTLYYVGGGLPEPPNKTVITVNETAAFKTDEWLALFEERKNEIIIILLLIVSAVLSYLAYYYATKKNKKENGYQSQDNG